MRPIVFRLTSNKDPEERLEEAALWKAMVDHYGPERIAAIGPEDEIPDDAVYFGRDRVIPDRRNPVSARLDYWEDPAFLTHCRRDFAVCDLSDAGIAVDELHKRGKGAFLKSTRPKHFAARIPVGTTFREAMGDMAYSFVDGPALMVQELVEMTYEYRFFVIGRKLVASSPVHFPLTPLDFPLPPGRAWRTPTAMNPEYVPKLVMELRSLAERTAGEMRPQHAVIDVAMVSGAPAIIEFNPLRLGHVGLFACDVRALAAASETLVAGCEPLPAAACPAAAGRVG